MPNLVYLIHFDEPYVHARHYMGSTNNLDQRLADHRTGRGARLMAVIRDAGITWRLARTWPGGRVLERRLKGRGHGPLCPICNPPKRRRHA